MKFASLIITGIAAAASPRDPCTELCIRDGPQICTGGSWTKGNGVCHAYLFRGDPAVADYCYHTVSTAATCPSRGHPVRASDVSRLLSRENPVVATTTTTTVSPPTTASLRSVAASPNNTLVEDEIEAQLGALTIREVARIFGIPGVIDQADRSLTPLTFWERVNGSLLLSQAVSTQSWNQASRMMRALRLVTIVPKMDLNDSRAVNDFVEASGFRAFCHMHRALIAELVPVAARPAPPGAVIPFADYLAVLCPEAFTNRFARLVGLQHAMIRAELHYPSSRTERTVELDMDNVFYSAVPLLTGPVYELLNPALRLRFSNRDDDSLVHWLPVAAQAAFESQGDGGLFVQRPGSEYVEIDLERHFVREHYVAFGRMLGLSALFGRPLSTALPRMFFRRLLDPTVRLEDVTSDEAEIHGGLRRNELAEERIAAIREGFDALVPVANIRRFVTPDDLMFWLGRTADIVVNDIRRNTRYEEPFHADHPQIRWLWNWLEGSRNEIRRSFLRFVTNESRIPSSVALGRTSIVIGGSLNDDQSPYSQTALFTLRLPLYTSAAELEEWMGTSLAAMNAL